MQQPGRLRSVVLAEGLELPRLPLLRASLSLSLSPSRRARKADLLALFARAQLTPDYQATASDTCGGIGAFCNDARSASLDMQATEAQEIFNGFCQSGSVLSLSPLSSASCSH